MSNQKPNKALIGTGILLAITSSLCCIMPVLAIIGGIGGVASSLSWVEPLRPYLIVATVLILGFAFYQAYKPKKADDCGCAVEEKKGFMASKKFLWIITIASVLLMSFPYYSGIFFSKPEKKISAVDTNNLQVSMIHIEGMNCKACEEHVNNALLKQEGVVEATSDYEKGLAQVKYDKTKTSVEELASATEKETGYKVKP
jgi:mercuric ion transport protein